MTKKSKKRQWFFAVNCPCGKINFIGAAPSPTASARPQTVLCVCGKRTSYQPDQIWLTPKGSK